MRPDTTSPRRSFAVGRFLAIAAAAALLAPLPGCSLDRRFGPAYHFRTGRAILRSATGAEVVVLSDGDPLFADEMFQLAWGYSAEGEAYLQSRFKRAIQRRLTALATDASARARFGDNPCIVEAPLIEFVEGVGTDTLPAEETGPEIPTCAGP